MIRRHPIAVLIAFLVTLCLAACGGGHVATGDAGAPAAAEKSSLDPASGWTSCADENDTCSFAGLRQVRYGTGSQYVVRQLPGPIRCDNATFGDPAVGIVKSCAFGDASWTACAGEGGDCRFDGTRTILYGSAGRYATQQATGSIACSNAVFGDPLVGVAKACWVAADAASPPVAAAPADPCEALPPMPALPASYKLVTSFCVDGRCALPDDDIDDTDAIDKALDESAGSVLVFPPGRYLIKRSLRVKRPGITLWGPGATIHATNSDDQSIIVEADNTSIYSFRLTAVTGQRGGRAEHTRIAIYGPTAVHPVVVNTVIRGNQIVNAGAPGTDLANSATGAGIFVNAADGFLIAENTVARSLADGIHVTGGARNGRVLANTVRETGDDMIAMVSYAYPDPAANVAATIAADFARSLGLYQDRNILVANNRLSGQYWGRGIAVVGGRDITIRGNALNNLPYGAAVLLAREPQSGSFGLDNIVVERNAISEVQTQSPPYDFGAKFASNGRTGHGAIEVEAAMFVDELASAAMVDGFAVHNLAIRDNTVTATAVPAVRVGIGAGSSWRFGSRAVNGGAGLGGVSIDGNAFSRIGSSVPIQILAAGTATCSADRDESGVLAAPQCSAPRAAAAPTGASLSCPGP